MTPQMQITYGLVRSAAEAGLVCPTNIDIEIACGYSSSSMGPKMLRKLEVEGFITVERFQRWRRVTITATGQSTAAPANAKSAIAQKSRGSYGPGSYLLGTNPAQYDALIDAVDAIDDVFVTAKQLGKILNMPTDTVHYYLRCLRRFLRDVTGKNDFFEVQTARARNAQFFAPGLGGFRPGKSWDAELIKSFIRAEPSS